MIIPFPDFPMIEDSNDPSIQDFPILEDTIDDAPRLTQCWKTPMIFCDYYLKDSLV